MKTCDKCIHKKYCYAYSNTYLERAESCKAYNDPLLRYVVDRNNIRKDLGCK